MTTPLDPTHNGETTMEVRDFDAAEGQAFQGDIAIVPVPADIIVHTNDEVLPIDGRLIIQEGEATGHHHAIDLVDRPDDGEHQRRKPSRSVERLMAKAIAGQIPVPAARMYRDSAAVAALVTRGVLTRADLAIGILVVERGPAVMRHEEHGGIRLPPGRYYIGGQVESAGAEQRRVID